MQALGKGQITAGIPVAGIGVDNSVASAVGNAGRAIGNVGKLAADIVEEEHRQYMTEAEIRMRQASADLQVELAKSKFDPKTHITKAREFYDKARNEILSDPRYTKGFRSELGKRLDLFVGGRIEKIGVNAQLMQLENSKRVLMKRMKLDREDGNFDGVRQGIDAGRKKYWSDEEADLQLRQVDRDESHSLRVADIQIDPAGELENIKQGKGGYMDLPTHDKRVYENMARRELAGKRRDDLQAIDDKRARGEITTPGDIDLMRDAGMFKHLSDADIAKEKAALTRDKDITADEQASWYAGASAIKEAREKGADKKTLSKMFNALESQARLYPAGPKRANMLRRLSSLDPYGEGGGSAPRNSRKETILRDIGEDAIYHAMRHGKFGTYHNKPDKDYEDPVTGENRAATTPELLKRRTEDNMEAKRKADELRLSLERMLQSNPNASTKDVDEFLQKELGKSAAVDAASILAEDKDSLGSGLLPPLEKSKKQLEGLTAPPQ